MMKYLVPVALSLSLSACLTAGMYRTAHVLPKNTGDISLHMNAMRVTTSAEVTEMNADGSTTTHTDDLTLTYPNLIPEVSYHYGIADDFEVGGRVALGSAMLELDGKYRFLGGPNESLHMAIQPAVGYRSWGLVEGAHVTLPLIATYDFNDNISLNGSGFATYTHYDMADDDLDDDADFGGDTIITGGALGVQFETMSGFHIMPAVEFQYSAYRSGDFKDLKWTALIFGVTLGWGGDKEMRKLNSMDQKMDKIDQKLDKIDQKLDAPKSEPAPAVPAPTETAPAAPEATTPAEG